MAIQALRSRVRKTLILLMYVIVLLTRKALAAGTVVAPACRRRCGDLDVPYPFGLDKDDPSCYLEPVTFSLTCNTSVSPAKAFFGNLEVVNISIPDAKLRILIEISYECYDASGPNDNSFVETVLGKATSTFSYTDNIYVAIGCDTLASIEGSTGMEDIGRLSVFNYTGGCTSSCDSLDQIQNGECLGFGCCKTPIPKGLRGCSILTSSNHNHSDVLGINPCGYSFLVEKHSYTFNVSDLKNMPKTRQFPVALDWYVGNRSCEFLKGNRSSYACISDHSRCINSSNGPGYICNCSLGYEGNPYEANGCQDVNECQIPESCKRGAVCINTPGNYSCTCPPGTIGDPYSYGCIKEKQSRMPAAAILGKLRKGRALTDYISVGHPT